MKIVIIHGQSHAGTTCHIARMLAEKLHGDTLEFFLPRDFNQFCTGCTACFMKNEAKCPHYEKLKPITTALDEADVIILESPVYVYHATGAMKAFLDHYGYRWMVHRPEASMFGKQAVCISTAAGAGMKSTNKDMADSTFFWGCAKTYTLGVGVHTVSWNTISPKIKAKVERKTSMLADQIIKRCGKVRPSLKTKLFFEIMRIMQKNGFNEADHAYWQEMGWLEKKRPWSGSENISENLISQNSYQGDIIMETNEKTLDKAYYAAETQQILDELEKSRTTAVIFNQKRCSDIPAGATKTGGLPDLPASVEYPVREAYTDENGNFCPALKMTLICQINCEELHSCYADSSIPEKGMLYIFWSGDDQEYFEKKYGVNTLRAFYWNGDSSTLVRKQADPETDVHAETIVTFSLLEEMYAEDIERRVENLIGELEQDCDDLGINLYDTEEYDALSELPDKCTVSNYTKLFGYRAGMIYSGTDFYNEFLQLPYRKGAIWYLYISVSGLRENKNHAGWNELKAYLDYDVD